MVTKEQLARLDKSKKTAETNRSIFISIWKDIAEVMGLSYGTWSVSSSKSMKTLADLKDVTDSTMEKCSNLMANGLTGNAFGRSIAWFSLAFEKFESDDNKVISGWLKDVEKQLYKQCNRSNFYKEARIFLRHGADFGTAVMFFEEWVEEEMPFFTTLHPKDVCLLENRFGVADTLFRDLFLDKYDAIQKFGEENIPDIIKESQDDDRKWHFCQYIGPSNRYKLDVDGTDPYISVYWCEDAAGKACKEERYGHKPFVAWRWNRDLEGSAYGTQNPGMQVLSDVKQLCSMTSDVTKLSQLQAAPPLKKTKGLLINVRPAGVTELEAGEDFAMAPVTGNLQFTEYERSELRQRIRDAYYSDIFLMLTANQDKKKTATEVAGLLAEKADVMSSFLDGLASEFLEPTLEFLYENEMRYSRLPALPEQLSDLAEEELDIDFISPLYMLQKRAHSSQVEMESIANIAGVYGQLNPEILDNIDLDKATRNAMNDYNCGHLLVPETTRNDVRTSRNEAKARIAAEQSDQAKAMNQAKIYQMTGKAPEEGSAAAKAIGA